MEKVKKENPEKKALIIKCFKKHFTHFGYKKTSVDEIARELKISKKTIYTYFQSKEDIFNFIVKKISSAFGSTMIEKLDTYTAYKDKMRILVQMIFSETKKWPDLNTDLDVKYKYEIISPAFRECYSRLIRKLILEGAEKGEFSVTNREIAALFITTIINESITRLTAANESTFKDETIHAINKLLG